jgi:3-deoxy-7-phosphoheptulonate synthase
MLAILRPDIDEDSPEYKQTWEALQNLPGIELNVRTIQGEEHKLTEVYLLGNTQTLELDQIDALPAVERVVRISQAYRVLGRQGDQQRETGFNYNGIEFSQNTLNVFPGLCAVDTPENVELMMKTLQDLGHTTTRMGAYKPRTNPYSFQGHGRDCLPYVFELAGKYGIKVIAMEITHDSQIEEIDNALEQVGRPTGVMLQIGTRNSQNFELLKTVGRQQTYPVLVKRGFGITLNDSLNAAEYLASEGNSNVIFCLRGMRTDFGSPHRNMVDFGHVPIVKRLTRMPVCIDPSHSVGDRAIAPDGILDIAHVTAQGVVSGANMVLVDFHPQPEEALVDGPQALRLEELPRFLQDVQLSWDTYQQRRKIWASEA